MVLLSLPNIVWKLQPDLKICACCFAQHLGCSTVQAVTSMAGTASATSATLYCDSELASALLSRHLHQRI